MGVCPSSTTRSATPPRANAGSEDHEQDGDRDRDLRQEDEGVQQLERRPGREEDPGQRLQEDRDSAHEDWRHLAAHRATGSQPAPTQRHNEEHGTERDQIALERVDDVGRALVGRDAERVQAVVEGQEQKPDELERNGDEEEDPDDREVASRSQASGRERQQEQGERWCPEVRQPQARGVDDRIRDQRHGPAEQPQEPDDRHQRPEAVGRAARPEEEAASDERQADEHLQHRREGERAQLSVADQHPEAEPGRGDQKQRREPG